MPPLIAVDESPAGYSWQGALQQSPLPLHQPELYCQLSTSPYNASAANGEMSLNWLSQPRGPVQILDRITAGEGKEGDIELLEELSEFMEMASLCALGKSAPNPVRSTIRYFRDEYEAHIREKRCPAGVCAALIAYEIDQEKCTSACGACARACPVDAIQKVDADTYIIVQEKCIKCGSCYTACPDKFRAVLKLPAAAVLHPTLIPQLEIETRA